MAENSQREGQIEAMEHEASEIGRLIARSLPDNWGFCLMVFELDPGRTTLYVSNARRADVVLAIRELADRLESELANGER